MINRKDPQVIYDCFFMSKLEFITIYQTLNPGLPKVEVGNIWHDIRRIESTYDSNLSRTQFEDIESEIEKKDISVERPSKKEDEKVQDVESNSDELNREELSIPDQIRKMYSEGMKKSKIAKTLDIHYSRVHSAVKRMKK